MPYVGHYDTVEYQKSERGRLVTEAEMARGRKDDDLARKPTLDHIQLAKLDNGEGRHEPTVLVDARENNTHTADREKLMERIKKGERPTWIPSASLQTLYTEEVARHQHHHKLQEENTNGDITGSEHRMIEDPFFGPWTEGRSISQPLPSSLHRGDFKPADAFVTPTIPVHFDEKFVASPTASVEASPPSWLPKTRPLSIGLAIGDNEASAGKSRPTGNRTRAPSLGSSLSSSFRLRTPTSPLAHAVKNSYMDASAGSNDFPALSARFRRRTLPPNATQSLQISPIDALPPNFSRPFPSTGRESSEPRPTHQPRRSLGSFTYQPSSSPLNHIRVRRLSLASEASHRQLTSMVGSFEESILRGRMSSPASQPFDFVAQIGVVGKGDCPSNLQCPAHVSVPFQAVFYRYPSSTQFRSVSDDAPSPYVGTIDLEHNLKPIFLSSKRKRASSDQHTQEAINDDPRAPENTPIGKALARDAEKQRRRSSSPKITLGGAYRVPQKGQLQIILKNQNKTAVKLFLVPYDLEGMQSGTKTFIRQKSYSKGSIVDNTADASASEVNFNDPLKDKRILRYLIHIKFCCPSKGKYYLHDHVRVVFANRVPDGKEKLENESQTPDPKYSIFRVTRQLRRASQTSIAEPLLMEEQYSESPGLLNDNILPQLPPPTTHLEDASITATGWGFNLHSEPEDLATSLSQTPSRAPKADSSHSLADDSLSLAEECFQRRPIVLSEASVSPKSTPGLVPISGFRPSTSTRTSPVSWAAFGTASMMRSFSPAPVEAGDGLLSRQFKNLNGDKPMDVSPSKSFDAVLDKSSSGFDVKEELASDRFHESEHNSANQEEHSEQGDISLHPIKGVAIRGSRRAGLDSYRR